MIKSFKSKSLKKYWIGGRSDGIEPKLINRVRLILSTMESAISASELDLPGLAFCHLGRKKMKGRYTISVDDSQRITFGWLDRDEMWIWKTNSTGKTLRDSFIEPSHPGELLNEIVIPATKRSILEIATLLGVSGQILCDILSEEIAVTPEMAVRLGKLFGNGTGLWLRMQSAYDLWHAERNMESILIHTLIIA